LKKQADYFDLSLYQFIYKHKNIYSLYNSVCRQANNLHHGKNLNSIGILKEPEIMSFRV